MTYVILVSDPGIGGRRNGASEIIQNWADRVDQSDGSSGGPIQFVSIHNPRVNAEWREIMDATLRGYEQASLRGQRGQIGVALGHGFSEGGTAWVDLAPRYLRVDHLSLEMLWRLVEAGTTAPRELTANEELFLQIGATLRRHHVRRIDLYSCSVGVGPEGQRLLDWIHYLWGVPIRGLRGALEFEGSTWQPTLPVYLRVLQPPGGRRLRHHGEWYVDQRITAPSLWTRSHRRRPELVGPPLSHQAMPPSPMPPPPSFP